MADNIQAAVNLLSSEKKEGGLVRSEEFFWDHFIRYIASLILALTVLNVTVEFLRGGGIFCFPPSDNAAIDNENLQGGKLYEFGVGQTGYINSYCARMIEQTEYFPIYILLHGIFLLVPHSLWNATFRGDFGSFFSIVNKLDYFRDDTGEYDSKKHELVRQLESEYGQNHKIFSWYIIKLVLQLLVCIGSFVVWNNLNCDIALSFCCPDTTICVTPGVNLSCSNNISDSIPDGWPLDINVPCIYTSIRILDLVRKTDLSLTVAAAALIVVGLVWCCVRHTNQLGYKDVAKFCFHSCLNEHFHSFPSILEGPSCKRYEKCLKSIYKDERAIKVQKKLTNCCTKTMYFFLWPFVHHLRCNPKSLVTPIARIRNDLDFLVMMLFRADTTHGKMFKSIQVSKYLKFLLERDNQQLHQFKELRSMTKFIKYEKNSAEKGIINPEEELFVTFKKHFGNLKPVPELFSPMRGWIYYCVSKYGPRKDSDPKEPRNNLAIDISFESVGFAPVLARPYERVISLDISSHTNEIRCINHSYEALRLPANIYAQGKRKINELKSRLKTIIMPKIKQNRQHTHQHEQTPTSVDQSRQALTNSNQLMQDCTNQSESTKKVIDFVVVGPLIESPQKVIVNRLLTHLFTEFGAKDACLLVICPLKVNSDKLTKKYRFPKYMPPEEYFETTINTNGYPIENEQVRTNESNPFEQEIKFKNICCTFEFSLHRYNGKKLNQNESI